MLSWKKRKILNLAKQSGCDLDGDLVVYRGKVYFVHVFCEVVEHSKAGENFLKKLPFLVRLKYNGSLFNIDSHKKH